MQKELNLCQRRWLELLKDYDITILYHPGMDNMMVDALSRQAESLGSLAYLPVAERLMAMDVLALASQFVRLDISEPSWVLTCVVSRSSLFDRIKERQYDEPHLLVLKDKAGSEVEVNEHCISKGSMAGTAGQGGDLGDQAGYVQSLSSSFHHFRELQYDDPHLLVLKDKVQHGDAKDVIIGDDGFLLLAEFAYNNSYQLSIQMAPYEALYGRRYRSLVGWFESGEARLLGTDLVQDALDKVKVIQEGLCTAKSRQKSYAYRKVRYVSYMIGEKVLLKFSPMKGVMRFGKKGKLSLRFIGHFEVLWRIEEVAYELALPSLSGVHPVFHVSMLRKYIGDLSHILDFSTVQLDGDLTYDMDPVAILERQVQKLRSKDITLVKVQWRGPPVQEAT
ncbi:uncharacterized protein [Nicotiana sylvestris]|uniref:uncharacterized protein n=1 Tax=Nicotiana sylvestris TaxID=4096 RepID=UPI00388C5E08